MAKRDLYDVLGVARNSTQDQIKTAYRKLARKYHPDMNKNNREAEEKFKEVQEAYDVLAEPEKRKNYDQFGHAGVAGGAQAQEAYEAFRRAQQQRGATRTWQTAPGVSVEDFDFDLGGNGGNLSDLFEQFFGARGGGGATRSAPFGAGGAARTRTRAPQRAPDIEYPVTLSFEQAARGTSLSLQISRDGRLENIEVKIPPGVKDGSRVRIKGRGEQAIGAEAGDLFIVTSVRPHPYFRREGLDVLVEVPISVWEAFQGTRISVPTLDGPVTLTVPPGTSSHAKLRIKSRGIFRGDEKGDQLCIIRINIPKSLDADERALLAQLAAKHPIQARADVRW